MHMVAGDPCLVRVLPEREHYCEMFLVMHGDLAHGARARAVADAIVAAVL
ncbi:hypothetical protein GCM10011572_00590 [Pseudoduganella buxea]|uniref:Uncharacterized protein n=1 Tax=Pseudoduganella buxea TaxID=1949069 RepID=A0ABQ1JZQ8_9BURK|nr:hypothetical protein GCM10011572_00590 [Pseudoduganella buxea]